MEDKRKALLRLLRRLETELRDCVSNDLAFEGLLCDFHSAEVTGPQDKVYALLAVAGVDETLLKPDYFFTVRKLYTSIARYLLAGDGHPTLQCLSYVQEMDEVHDLPSWVSDWSMSFVMHTIEESNNGFQATGNSQESAIYSSPFIDNDNRQIPLTV